MARAQIMVGIGGGVAVPIQRSWGDLKISEEFAVATEGNLEASKKISEGLRCSDSCFLLYFFFSVKKTKLSHCAQLWVQ